MKKTETEDLPEADALPGAPHPRHVYSLVGHQAAEEELLSAYRDGRLAHAWLIGGREGVGKATLAWRFARFVLANPDPTAKAVREARDLRVDPSHSAARLLAQLAHPGHKRRRADDRAGKGPLDYARRGRGGGEVGPGKEAGRAPSSAWARGRPHTRARRLAGRRGAAEGDPFGLRGSVQSRRACAVVFPAAARVDHIDETILPALASGAWVVCDRFADSTRAYQGAAGNLSPDFITCLERLAVGANTPDLTLVLDLAPEVGLERAAKRRQGRGRPDRFENRRASPFTKRSGGRFSTSPPPSPGVARSSTPAGPRDESPPIYGPQSSARLDPAGALKSNCS